MVAGVIHISDQFEQLQKETANEKEWRGDENQEINCALPKQDFQQDARLVKHDFGHFQPLRIF